MSERGFNPNFLVFIVLIYLLNSGGSGNGPTGAIQHALEDVQLVVDRSRIDTLANITFEGRDKLLLNDTIDHERLSTLLTDLRLAYDQDLASPIYRNASSTLTGSWQTHLEAPTRSSVNATEGDSFYHDTRGTVSATLDDYQLELPPAARARLDLKFTSKRGFSTRDVILEGIHLRETGEMLLASDHGQSHGVFFVPALSTNQSNFELIQTASKEILQHRINARRVPDDEPNDGCSLYALVRIHRLRGTNDQISRALDELHSHTGLPYREPQAIRISGYFFSLSCDISISFELKGVLNVQLNSRAQNHAIFFICVVILQIYTIAQQMRNTASPSNLWRISLWCIGLQCLLDGYNAVVLLICGLTLDTMLVPMISASFLSFLAMALYGLRYLLLIYRMQRQLVPSAASQAEVAQETVPTELPQPTAALSTRPLTDAEIERRDLSTLYIRFYFALLALLLLSLQVAYLPNSLRDIISGFGVLLVNSYWLPQIYRQAKLGHRQAFSFRYVSTITICRLVPVLYIYAWPSNILLHEQEWTMVWIVLLYAWLQVVILAGQSMFGPRFFMPKDDSYASGHDYHLFPTQDMEAGKNDHDNACTICMAPLNIDAASSSASVLVRRTIMRTPCNHYFHTSCLREWMEQRLRCPICRSILPPE